MTSVHSSQPLDDVAYMLSGGTPRKSNQSYWNGLIPWLTPKDIGNWSGATAAKVSSGAIGNGTRLAPVDAIFIVVRGMSLHNEIRVLRPAQAMTFNQDIKAIVARRDIDPRYLYYVILSKKPELLDAVEAAGHGTGRLPTDRLKDLPIPRFGGLAETAIAELFNALDCRINLNRRMNETLESMARAIFTDWFVDFGPTRTKAGGREPYLAPGLWDLFPDALDDEGKPVGWSVCPVSELFEFNPREWVKKGTYTPYLNMAALPTSGAVADAPIHREYKSGSRFRDGDTLFARITPCLENGKTAYVFDMGNGVVGTGSTEFIVIRSRTPRPAPASYFLARDQGFRAYAERSMTGTSGRQRASREALSQYELAAPTDDHLWNALDDFVTPMMDRVIANAHESRALAQTRDLLLPKLMSGEIRLGEAEKAMEVEI